LDAVKTGAPEKVNNSLSVSWACLEEGEGCVSKCFNLDSRTHRASRVQAVVLGSHEQLAQFIYAGSKLRAQFL
jgi:hypothetical protein